MSSSKDKIAEYMWVQCENPQCMMWRKVSAELSTSLQHRRWFCHMNKDNLHNSCDIPEEKMQVPKGETVVFSELECGTLVWAKMSGYPKWPAIISPDPGHEHGIHIIRYNDGTGDPLYYHVEFLGSPHSHAWIISRHIQVYHTASADLVFEEKSMRKKRAKEQFQCACLEASKIINLSLEQKLKQCIYTWEDPTEKKVRVDNCNVNTITSPKHQHVVIGKKGTQNKGRKTAKTKYSNEKYKLHVKLPKVQRKRNRNKISHKSVQEKEEETFVIDKTTFWQSYKAFNGITEVESVNWYNKKIDLYDFFKAVQMAGGYKQATSHWMIWRSICWRLTDSYHLDSRFRSLRKAYRQNLLSFEEKYNQNTETSAVPVYLSSSNKSSYCNSIVNSQCSSSISNSLQESSGVKVLLNDNCKLHKGQSSMSSSSLVGLNYHQISQEQPIIISSSLNMKDKVLSPVYAKQDTLNLFSASSFKSHLPVRPTDFVASPVFHVEPSSSQIKSNQPEGGFDCLGGVVIEIDELDKELEGFEDLLQPSYDSQMTLFEETSFSEKAGDNTEYQPQLSNSIHDEFCDVIGQLTELEDTLLEIASDTLSNI